MSQGTDAQVGADGRRILGSAEPLTSEQREVRLRELAEWGVDLSLSSALLGKSPTERVEDWIAFHSFAEELQRAVVGARIHQGDRQGRIGAVAIAPNARIGDGVAR